LIETEVFLSCDLLFQQAKKVISDFKRNTSTTGGGPPPVTPTDVYWKIYQLIPNQFERISCNVDSDAGLDENCLENEAQEPENELDLVSSGTISIKFSYKFIAYTFHISSFSEAYKMHCCYQIIHFGT
jgi:hypothetical protein